MSSINPKNIFRFKIVIVFVTLLICLCVYYLFFLRAVKKQQGHTYYSVERTDAIYPFSNQRQVLNLGWIHKVHDGLSSTSYLFYDTLKKPGIFRIGLFGCSFSEAFDVSSRHDLASLLQQRYKREGYDSVEVISFGTGGYGLGQMHLLYEYAGKKYDLDVVAVNSFFMYHFPRDLSFRLYNNYGPLHARYITTGDSIKLIEYADTTLAAAYNDYYSLLPDKNFLRYDYKPTGFLLPLGLSFNPFYYRNEKGTLTDLMNEARELYEGILKKFASDVKQLVVICNDEHSYALKERFQEQKNVSFFQSRYYEVRNRSTSLYTSTSWHNSPLGNQFYADELFDFLEKGRLSNTCLRLKVDSASGINDNTPFDSLGFVIGSAVIHQLYSAAPTDIGNEDWNREPDYAEPVLLTDKNISTLLLLNENCSDLSFVNLKKPLTHGDTVFVSIRNNEVTDRFAIGSVRQLAPHIFQVKLFKNSFMQSRYMLQFKQEYQNLLGDFRLLFLTTKSIPHVIFFIGKNELTIEMEKKPARLIARHDAFNLSVDHVPYFLSESFHDKTLLSAPAFAPQFNTAVMRCRMNGTEYLPQDSMVNGSARFDLALYKNGSLTIFPFLKIVTDSIE